jgi:hypothetical protein
MYRHQPDNADRRERRKNVADESLIKASILLGIFE